MIEEEAVDLVVGSGGFLGSALFNELSLSGPVLGVDREALYQCRTPKNKYLLKRCSNILEVFDFVFDRNNVSNIYYLISSLRPNSNRQMFLDDLRAQNVILNRLLLRASQAAAKINFISSGGAIYGNYKQIFNETDICKPRSFYGVSKLRQENYIKDFANNNDLKFAIFRPSNVYGSSQVVRQGQGLIKACVNSANSGKRLNIFTGLDTARDYIHVADFLRQLVFVSKKHANGEVYNLGSGEILSVQEVVDSVTKYYKKSLSIHRSANVCNETIIVGTEKIGKLMNKQTITLKDYLLTLNSEDACE